VLADGHRARGSLLALAREHDDEGTGLRLLDLEVVRGERRTEGVGGVSAGEFGKLVDVVV